jgi:hypothetical protein
MKHYDGEHLIPKEPERCAKLNFDCANRNVKWWRESDPRGAHGA